MHGDCEWEIAECTRDAVESKFCDVPQAIFMFGNSFLVAAPVSLSSQHVNTKHERTKARRSCNEKQCETGPEQ